MHPGTPTSIVFPKPSTDDLFERWCLLIFRAHLGGANWDRFRGRGRVQHGIDLLGRDRDNRLVAVQCKLRNASQPLTLAEIEADVKKAKKLDPQPEILIFATTDESKALQQEVLALSQERQAAASFAVEIKYWGDLCDLINEHPEIHAQLGSTLRNLPTDNLRAAGIQQNQNFVGRKRELAKLHTLLTAGHAQITQAIVGEGGIGKSELAKQYLFKYADHWDGRWWLEASEAAVDGSTAKLAELLLGADSTRGKKPDQIRLALLDHLGSARHLLVLDNVETPARAQQYALRPPARVLITTRRRDIPAAVAGKLELEVLEPEEAVELLTSGCKNLRTAAHRPRLEAIVDHLGCHALAVAVAGARLAQPLPPTPAELLAQLQNAEVGALEDPFEQRDPNEELGTGYRHKVAASLSLHHAAFANTPAQHLLELAAFCHPTSIPVDLLAQAANLPLDEGRQHLRALHAVSILKCDEAVSIHRLMQSAVRAKLPVPARRAALTALVGALTEHFADPNDYQRWAEMGRYASHATAVVEHSEKLGEIKEAGHLANQAGLFLQKLGRFDAARANVEKAVAIQLKHFAPDHPTLAISYSNLATIQYEQGELPAARANLEKAIEIQLKHFAPDHPTLGTMFSNLAMIQQDQGDLPVARANLEKAIAIELKHFASDHPTLGTSFSNLALIQKDQGDLPGARANMEKAIAIKLKHLAPDHPTLATSYHNRAGIFADEKDFTAAVEWETKALAIFLKHFTDEHPHVKLARRCLARYRAQAGPGA